MSANIDYFNLQSGAVLLFLFLFLVFVIVISLHLYYLSSISFEIKELGEIIREHLEKK